MKSRAKVISQKHIKEIPPFCDNPMGKDSIRLQEAIERGDVHITPNRRQRKAAFRGRVKH